MALGKKLINHSADADLRGSLELEAVTQSAALRSAPAVEGFESFRHRAERRRSEHRHSRRPGGHLMNIANLLRRSASDNPDQVALRLDDTEITYAGYAEHGGRFAAFLRASGVEPGERVGFFLPNCLEYLPGLLGVWQAGAVGVPLNYMFPDAALRHAVVDSGARYLVVLPGDVARLTDVLGDALPELLTLGPDGTYEAALAAHEPATDVTPRVDGDDALLDVHVRFHRRPEGRAPDPPEHDRALRRRDRPLRDRRRRTTC